MLCLNCKSVTLKQKIIKSTAVQVDYCPKCKGIWFDFKEYESVSAVAVRDLEVPTEALKGNLPCPRCRQLLYEFNYPGTLVTIEMCGQCKGIWLDEAKYKEIEMVRRHKPQVESSEDSSEIPGFKGKLIHLINTAIDRLKDESAFALDDERSGVKDVIRRTNKD